MHPLKKRDAETMIAVKIPVILFMILVVLVSLIESHKWERMEKELGRWRQLLRVLQEKLSLEE